MQLMYSRSRCPEERDSSVRGLRIYSSSETPSPARDPNALAGSIFHTAGRILRSVGPPCPSNDTEMAVFGLMFALCLVLIVCKLTAALAMLISLVLVPGLRQSRGSPRREARLFLSSIVPQISPPLRI